MLGMTDEIQALRERAAQMVRIIKVLLPYADKDVAGICVDLAVAHGVPKADLGPIAWEPTHKEPK